MARRTNRQNKLQNDLDYLLEICRLQGIDSRVLRTPVHEIHTDGIHPDSVYYEDAWHRADEVSAAGVSAQLAYLLEVWGMKKLRNFLNNTGGVLDAIALATGSSPEELEADIGRSNIDENGDVL